MSSNNCSPGSAQQSEDLKYFEERLKSNLSFISPHARRWKAVFSLVLILLIMSLIHWWNHFDYDQHSVIASLCTEPSLLLCLVLLVILLLLGAHHRCRAPAIIADRVRLVLKDYNMSVDNAGRLILLPSKQPPRTNGR
ncbi:nuclear envelope phosphatase-regulatory subunit 1-like [Sycon ciliatum]|uniref:nuclear envelope phosphatase-regulatory subunit 1-like n=1 Tax=Sycon ciliatum TaxID=27933 RepID=UPI0020AE0F94|eukprot:scpid80041/ scgid10489/ Nuclear envelope phosphatase-regulatory subunit 1; Transmembrane protein 188